MAQQGNGVWLKVGLVVLPLILIAAVTVVLAFGQVQQNRDALNGKADKAVVDQQFKTVDAKLDEVLRRLERIERNQ